MTQSETRKKELCDLKNKEDTETVAVEKNKLEENKTPIHENEINDNFNIIQDHLIKSTGAEVHVHSTKSKRTININENVIVKISEQMNLDTIEHETPDITSGNNNETLDLITLNDLGIQDNSYCGIQPMNFKTSIKDFLKIPPEPARKGKRNILRLPYHISGPEYKRILEDKTKDIEKIETEKRERKSERERKKEDRKRKAEEIKTVRIKKKKAEETKTDETNKTEETKTAKTEKKKAEKTKTDKTKKTEDTNTAKTEKKNAEETKIAKIKKNTVSSQTCYNCSNHIKHVALECSECHHMFHKSCVPKSHREHIPEDEGDKYLCDNCYNVTDDGDKD
ncbi:hypothetical protein O0L34_g3672 [Tuta absoluta]|nr:hypothetical protein O0L34_g3672 [Tuta absoluta]